MANVTWKSDPTHSEIEFKVKHLMITTVTGYFGSFEVEAQTGDDNFTNPTNVVFTADVDSLSTHNDQRDTHLKSADFFDAENHGQIRFVGNKYEQVDGDYKLHGDLTIRGTTQPVVVDVDFGGIVVDPSGQTKAGFSIHTKIKRKEFGLTWDAVTEAGSVVVSDEIRISGEIQLVKQG